MHLLGHSALLAAAAAGVGAETTWTTASQMRQDMEMIIKEQAKELQSHYQVLVDLEEVGSCASGTVLMCDASADAWDEDNEYVTRHPQFVNPETGTCVRYDLDVDGNFLEEPVTGRKTCLDPAWDRTYSESGDFFGDPTACEVDESGDLATPYGLPVEASERCAWSPVEEVGGNNFEPNPVSKHDALDEQYCTDPALMDLCYINNDPEMYGYAIPDDASYDINDDRPKAEICATNDLVEDIGEYSFSSIQEEYPQTAWAWLGMQETGIYRTWPGLYQCRTEAQCSGCSDPRFRGWYASAASGSKDVVIVIDTSGSMQTESSNGMTRLQHVKTAATWVVNTLSAADFFTVVSFSGDADEASETLLPATAENKAFFKDFISGLDANGQTYMDKAFEKAFEVLGDSTDVGVSTSGCTQNILFLTDGDNTGSDADVLDAIREYNGGSYEGVDLHFETGATGEGLTLISTYTFGDDVDASSLMKDIACENGGVYHTISDADAVHLKEVMGNYYTYMAAGQVPDSVDDDVPARWVDIFEDGQGRGQETGACSPVYNWATSPPELFGILCLGIWMPEAEALAGWEAEWADIQSDQAVCHDLFLTWSELESLRSKTIGSKQYTGQCEGRYNSGASASEVGAIVGGVVGGLVAFCLCAMKMCRGKSGGGGGGGSQTPTRSVQMTHAAPAQHQQFQQPAYNPSAAQIPVAHAVAMTAPPQYNAGQF